MNFFEFREQMSAKRGRAGGDSAPVPGDAATGQAQPPRPLSVSQLTAMIDRVLRGGLPASILVQGEVSNFNHHRGSGHLYFTLKDESACIDCVVFRSDAARMKFKPEDGMELIAGGRVQVYPARGRYQLYVTSLHPVGRGALEVAFQQLCTRLRAEGLFAPERKRPIPRFPRRIALVTSRQTAALQDILKVLRRFPWIRLGVYHVPVQGDGSAEQIAAALKHLGRARANPPLDLILLSRGGGSLEDLWEFNEECVARAIVACPIPVVTGIGHEVDTSIADLVADYHAHTPTEAAQVVTAAWRAAGDQLQITASRLTRSLRANLQECRQRLLHVERHEAFRRPVDRINLLRQLVDDRQRSLMLALSRRLRREQVRLERVGTRLLECHPRHQVELNRQRSDALAHRVRAAMLRQIQRRALVLDAWSGKLEALSPQRVLQRGFSITLHKKRGMPVRSAAELKQGDRLITRFADGSVESTVDDPRQPSLFE